MFMKKFFCLLAASCLLLGASFTAEAKLTEAQEEKLDECLAPIRKAQNDMRKACELLIQVREGKIPAGEAAPELKRLLDSVDQNRRAFFAMPKPEDEEVAKVVSMWMRWNREKLSTYTNFLIQLGNEFLNAPNTDVELISVFEQSFFAGDLHRLSQYSAEDLAKVDSELKILKQYTDCMRECVGVLHSITNKAEADAAAPRVKQLLGQLKPLAAQVMSLSPKGKSEIHREIVNTAAYTYGLPLLMMEMEGAMNEVSSEHEFFGSAALKEALDEA